MKSTFRNMPAVVLAGGESKALFPSQATRYKALLRYRGLTSLEYTLEALRKLPSINRICIIGPIKELAEEIKDLGTEHLLPARQSMADNVELGLEYFSSHPEVLFATADCPLITPRAVTDFLSGVSETHTEYASNLFIPVVPGHCYKEAYSDISKGILKFRDISVRHGNLAVLDSRLFGDRTLKRKLNNLYKYRKSAAKATFSLGFLAGLGFLFGVLFFRRLSLDQVARMVSRSLGVGVHPVILTHPEITLDVDEPEDYVFVKKRLEPIVTRDLQ
jgi:CTP:molybdopterin cytidylyltransferase MocA